MSGFTFKRIGDSERMSVERDGESIPVLVRIDIDTFAYIAELPNGQVIARVPMAEEHWRLRLEAAIREHLERG